MISPAGVAPQLALYASSGSSSTGSGVRGALTQQELQGQAAVKLIESAAIPANGTIGQNIDIYA